MESIKSNLQGRVQKKRNLNLHSEIHALADEISSYFGERKKFGMYLGVIKRIGVTRARAIFSEVRDGNARDPHKLFIWQSQQIKTKPAAAAEKGPARRSDAGEKRPRSKPPRRRQISLFDKIGH